MPTTAYAQMFCTVADLVADMKAPGADEAMLYQHIKEASDYLQKEIGWFLPVTLTRNFNGRGRAELLVPPLLAITSIVNDGTTLATTDYIKDPEDGFWPNGPYGKLIVDPDATNLSAWVEEEDGIQVAGQWGLYLLSKSTGALVKNTTQQAAADASLVVDNGSAISPGMVLLIGTEQELVTGWGSPSDSTTNVGATAVAATDPTILLVDASKVSIGEIIRLDFEQMKVLDRNTTTNEILVRRGWNGTQATTHSATTTDVYVYRTATVERGMNGTTAAIHAADVAISRYVVPDDVLFLTKEIATLMLNKASSGYQGRTGNDQGVIFYNDAFPKQDIERVRQAYMLRRVG